MIDPLTYFWIFIKATVLSTGGLGNLPSLEQDLIARHWATSTDFGAALAVGQTSPGPTGLWVISLGYLTFGWVGVVLAATSAVLPPLLIIPVNGLHKRFGDLPWASDFVHGLSLAVVAVVPIVMMRLVFAHGFDWKGLVLVAGSFLLMLTRRAPPVLVLVLTGFAALAVYR